MARDAIYLLEFLMLLRLLVGSILILAIYFFICSPKFLGARARITAVTLAVVGLAGIVAIEFRPPASPPPSVIARPVDEPAKAVPPAEVFEVRHLVGCQVFKDRLNSGLKRFGNVRAPITWQPKPAYGRPSTDEETANFPQSQNALACDENGMTVISAGLYEDTPTARTEWRSFSRAVIFASDPDATDKKVDETWAGMEADIGNQIDRLRRDAPTEKIFTASVERSIGNYRLTYESHVHKTPYEFSYVAHIAAKAAIGKFSYAGPSDRADLVSCGKAHEAVSADRTPRKPVRLAHLSHDAFQLSNGSSVEILCDIRGRLRGINLTAPNGARIDQGLASKIAGVVGAPAGELSKLREQSAEDLRESGGCPDNRGFASQDFGPYDLKFSIACDREEVSIDSASAIEIASEQKDEPAPSASGPLSSKTPELENSDRSAAAAVTAVRVRYGLFTDVRSRDGVLCVADYPFLGIGVANGEFFALNGIARGWAKKNYLSVYQHNKWIAVKENGVDPLNLGLVSQKPIDVANKLCPRSSSTDMLEDIAQRTKEGEDRLLQKGSAFGLR